MRDLTFPAGHPSPRSLFSRIRSDQDKPTFGPMESPEGFGNEVVFRG